MPDFSLLPFGWTHCSGKSQPDASRVPQCDGTPTHVRLHPALAQWLFHPTAMAEEERPAPDTAEPDPPEEPALALVSFKLFVNGTERALELDARTTLLDALREHLHLTGTKKGCDHGQCGACTVLVGGRRINSCLTLAVMHEGEEVTTIEGLGAPGRLHPLQAVFIRHDGFQCGYCTPGQICSAVGMLQELRAGMPSHVSPDLGASPALNDDEIRERMSGNLCRCSAYTNIVAAIREVGEGA